MELVKELCPTPLQRKEVISIHRYLLVSNAHYSHL